MKTLNVITRTIFAAIIIVSMSSNLEAQKAYHNRPIENGIAELNMMANRLIEKCKVKFDLTNSLTVLELETMEEAFAENELNRIADQLIENIKFDVNNTVSVNEASLEYDELNQSIDELMTKVKFEVNETISVTEEMAENNELDQLTNELMENLRFDVNQTISVNEFNEENSELNQAIDILIANNVTFDLSKTNAIQDDQLETAF